MKWENTIVSSKDVRLAINTLQEPGHVFEVRIIGTSKREILSGYFKDADTLLGAFENVSLSRRNVYITLGRVKDECFSRAQSERFLQSPQTTSDNEIISYRWLFVDLDPVRPAGISSSDEELRAAEQLSEDVLGYMDVMGFPKPVTAISGNGYHLLYRIDIPNDKEGRALIERCLKSLADRFNTDKVKIDTTNANPSRICKLHGTLAQKGANTRERPHRMSKILSIPQNVQVADKDALLRLTAGIENAVPADQPRSNEPSPQKFDLLDFMDRHGMRYEVDSNDRANIFRLDECPFDPSHKNGDAKIFQYPDGAIAFKCHHNSCKNYRWQDVRLKFEPDAFDRPDSHEDDERIDQGYRQHVEQKEVESLLPKKSEQKSKPKPPKKLRELKTAEALLSKDLPEPRVFIGEGDELPFLVEGTCILSAKPKLGKSWLALCMCLAVSKGEDFLGYKTHQCSTLYLDLETHETLQKKRIMKVLKGSDVPKNFYIESETDTINNGFVDQIEAYLAEDPNIGIVVIDVFQIIRTPAASMKESEYEHAYRDITPLNELAQKYHISIILVCHDRKAVDPDDPFANILGSTGLQGAATQMIVMFKSKKNDPIHISVKGKTIDGLPELNVRFEDAQWEVTDAMDSADREQKELVKQYRESRIREAVLKLIEKEQTWKGRCGRLINDACYHGVALTETPKEIGGFLHRHQGRFLAEDGIQIEIIDNGTGPKIYKLQKFTIDTIDENDSSTIDGFINTENMGPLEIPFP